jgi:hypothetical protein
VKQRNKGPTAGSFQINHSINDGARCAGVMVTITGVVEQDGAFVHSRHPGENRIYYFVIWDTKDTRGLSQSKKSSKRLPNDEEGICMETCTLFVVNEPAKILSYSATLWRRFASNVDHVHAAL